MVRILVLEDNPKALEVIMKVFQEIKKGYGEIAVTVFSEAKLVDQFLEKNQKFDLVLLDYFSIDGNFHEAVFEKIDPEKIIAISSIRKYNLKAQEKGVLRSVQKQYVDLSIFKNQLKKEIINYLN